MRDSDHKEGWAPKNWCVQIVVLEQILESPLDCKEIQPVSPKGNQPWIFIGRIDVLKLMLQYFGHLMWRANSVKKNLMLGKIEGWRRKGRQRMRCLEGIINSVDVSLSTFWQTMQDREAWSATVHESPKSWTWLSDWTATKNNVIIWFCYNCDSTDSQTKH